MSGIQSGEVHLNGNRETTLNGHDEPMTNGHTESTVNGHRESIINGQARPYQNGDHNRLTNGHTQTTLNGHQEPTLNGMNGHTEPTVNGNSTPPDHRQVPIAVVGTACRLPGNSNTPHALWDFLYQGSIAKNEPPRSRFNLAGHYDGSGKPGTMPGPGGMFLENVDPAAFDASFFDLNTTDAVSMDPQQRQLLEVTYECLENSGQRLDTIRGSEIGCVVGAYSNDYEGGILRDPEDQVPGLSTGVSRSLLSNRISNFFDITGPSITLDTACSSTLIGVDMACRYMQSNQVSGMVVAGSTMWLDPFGVLDRGLMSGAYTKSGKCHTFDADADGYVRAEGINAVYLKRLDDAIKDGDPIRAVIRGSATNSNGRTVGGITVPNSEAQAAAIRSAYRRAGISDFNETGYLECHGTGTLAGDPIEVEGAASVFGPTRSEDNPLIIGSIKSNIGHSEAAAGLSGLIKAVLAVERGMIPGNPTFCTPNPKIDFKQSRVKATKTAVKWPSSALRRASVNSFGFGGANAHVVIESADCFLGKIFPQKSISSYHNRGVSTMSDVQNGLAYTDAKRPFLLPFSANDKDSLKKNVEAISNHLINPSVMASLSDVAYTLSEKRNHSFHRGFIVTKSIDFFPGSETTGKAKASAPRIGFIFTGQGAQWSQMGKDLIQTFPLARDVIEHLDAALRTLARPPKWSLLAELTEKRDPQTLRRPEFSQPLVTALQIAQLEVLSYWDIKPEKVVGHSSGEIAAAVAAGFVSPADAIKIAYLRGQAANECPPTQSLSMLAVGVSAEDVKNYLDPAIHIACYNSPSSLTLSGPVSALETVRDRLQRDGHFARFLQVDLAYHSEYMKEIGDHYMRLLLESGITPVRQEATAVSMYSSATGRSLSGKGSVGPEYWLMNMVCPVQFTQATAEMLSGSESPEYLVEVGPSNALVGPVSQITKALGGSKAQVQYVPAAKRGPNALATLFEVAGKLWASGGHVDLSKVNAYQDPCFVFDLPNYQWNHSNRYWHQGLSTEEWRAKKFVSHDLLGSKMPGSPWKSPTFLKCLNLNDQPWLRDHDMGEQIIFPASGYLAMAMEAIYQTMAMNEWSEREAPATFRYRMKDVKFLQALILPEKVFTKMMLSLSPVHGSLEQWYYFKVEAYGNDTWTVHSSGLIRIDENYAEMSAPPEALAPFEHTFQSQKAYKNMKDAGYKYGPGFQRLLRHEWGWGKASTRGELSMEYPQSNWGQSSYPLHPVCTDSFFQLSGLPIKQVQRAEIDDNIMLVPGALDSMVVPATRDRSPVCMAITKAAYLGYGRTDSARSYRVSGGIYDPRDGSPVLEMKGFRLDQMGSPRSSRATDHVYNHQAWDAEMSLTSAHGLNDLLRECSSKARVSDSSSLQRVLDLVAHQTPALDVLEVNINTNDRNCQWLSSQNSHTAARSAFNKCLYISNESDHVLQMQDRHSDIENAAFNLVDITQENADISTDSFDFAIVKMSGMSPGILQTAMANVRRVIRDQGQLLLVERESSPKIDEKESVLKALGFSNIKQLYGSQDVMTLAELPSLDNDKAVPKDVFCVRFKEVTQVEPILNDLRTSGWNVISQGTDTSGLPSGSTIVVLDELSQVITGSLTGQQLEILRDLVRKECNLLWVTQGAQLEVTNPDRAMTQGLLRTIRSEEPHLRIIALDVEQPAAPATTGAILTCLELLTNPEDKFRREHEFAERRGIIHVPRILPDEKLNEAKFEAIRGRTPRDIDIHEHDTSIRLRAERIGNIDSVFFGEVTGSPPLKDDWIEVEIHATGVNFKDVAITMGIAPGDESQLGAEGAGIIRRVGAHVKSCKPGQRVAGMFEGCFANRVQAPACSFHKIPDEMTFDEAASVPVVYSTSFHALFDLGGLERGQRVLIHSATGGVGNAAIQLCQYMNAEVYATVGTDEKREFLKHNFDIPDERIFSSRTTDFADKIMQLTDGHGMDIILNSLIGEMLEASWSIVARGGTMVEIGVKDIHDHKRLSMEYFMKGASYRALDMSQWPRFHPERLSKLWERVFELLERGNVKPVFPLQRYETDQVTDVFRLIRSGKHTGKLVIVHKAEEHKKLQVRPAPRTVKFRDDVCYLIVGGLKGLGGSIAVDLAKNGAKNLAVISRSGYDDDRSRLMLQQIQIAGGHVDLIQGDVTVLQDVKRAFTETSVPIGGIIHCAMVLHDRPFSTMTIDEYHKVLTCKVQGTWNLHNAALEESAQLDFFTMLSSISSVGGTKGQANYVAANMFLDAFGAYRNHLGLPANAINLGFVEDEGYGANSDFDAEKLTRNSSNFVLNANLLFRIVQFSNIQQSSEPINAVSKEQMVTGLTVPLPADSGFRLDKRFDGLYVRNGTANQDAGSTRSKDNSRELRELNLLLRSKTTDQSVLLDATLRVVSNYLAKTLRLDEAIEVERPLSKYGLDSLATVEFRNWLRLELGAALSTLDVTVSPSLVALCQKVISKVTAA